LAVAHWHLGLACTRLGELDAALEHYRQVLWLPPEPAVAHRELGPHLHGRGHHAEAVAHLSLALRLLPEDAEMHNDLALALLRLGRSDALQHFRSACWLAPDSAGYACNLAIALRTLGGPGILEREFVNKDVRARLMEAVFTGIYRGNLWQNTESRSGSGSTMAGTAIVRSVLGNVIDTLGVQTLLDAPCGDFNWMKEFPLGGTHYVGIDVVAELIEENRLRFGRPGRDFLHQDLTAGDLPCADLILCRDCLVHFSNACVWRALAAFRRSGSGYLLTTTFPARARSDDIETGGWRPLNLEAPPFCLPPPVLTFREGCPVPEYADKALGLWLVRQLPEAPATDHRQRVPGDSRR
jgi:hypothetical protein